MKEAIKRLMKAGWDHETARGICGYLCKKGEMKRG